MGVLTAADHQTARRDLDRLFLTDAVLSVTFGVLALLSPHRAVSVLAGPGNYNHSAHEALRLYGCLRVAVGWILFRIRSVDDGQFRRAVTEALCLCYLLQSLAVLRAQLTGSDDRAANLVNWAAMVVLVGVGGCYARFRFGKGGDLIKIYELPLTGSRAQR